MTSEDEKNAETQRADSRSAQREVNEPAADWQRPEHFFGDIVDALPDPTFVKDEQHRWIAVNEAFCQLMGKPREEILGKSDFDYFPDTEARTFWEKDEEVFRTGKMNENEEPLTTKEGETRTIITKKVALTDAAGRKILLGIIRDITDRKKMEEDLRSTRDQLELRVEQRTREAEEAQEKLRQAQKMEAVGQLTGGMAHDFNNMLGVILGNIELARMRPDRPDMGELLDNALSAAERGATLIQRLLAFSRQQTLQPRLTDIAALVDGMLQLLVRTLGEGIEVRTGPATQAAWCVVDPAQLESALLNLCINSRDAMPQGGTLTIEHCVVDVAPEFAALHEVESGRYVLVEVSDVGTGMQSAVRVRACDPFFTTKGAGEGSGLGLSMVYGFVRQSRGIIDIASELGKGTTVRLFLPEHAPPADVRNQRATIPQMARHGEGQRILVVEDDAAMRQMVVMLLEGLGYLPVHAGSAREAWEHLRTSPPFDLLLTDVVLAGAQGGGDLAQRVRAAYPQMALMFMSGYARNTLPEWIVRAHQLIDKPFRRRQLAQAVAAALRPAPSGAHRLDG